MKKSILISALLLCIAPSVFGQEDELKTAMKRKEKKNKKQQYINKEEAERIRKEEEQREKAKDIPYIKNYIKEVFIEWAKKGEFESSKEHFERIQNEGLATLYKITAQGFLGRTYKKSIEISLGEYNADEEIYPMIITYEISDYKMVSKGNVSFKKEEAIEFKEAIKREKDTRCSYYRFSERNPDNWFVQDGFLFPINVEYTTTHSFDYDDHLVGKLKKISDKGDNPLFSEYVFNTDDLGLSEYFPENHTFTLEDYFKSLKEKQKNN